MVAGFGKMVFHIHDCRSLKEKRKVVKALITRLRNAFNASIAEVGANDVYQRAEIGFAVVGNSQSVVNAKMDKLIDMAEDLGLCELMDSELEIIHL